MLTRFWSCTSVYVTILSQFYLINGDISYGEQLFSTFRLSEYQTFGDVTLFHVIIPPHCMSARWDIGVLKNNVRCPETGVNLALQAGSLPLTNPYNTSFPPHTNTASQHNLNQITIMSDQPVSISFGNPVPGYWYMTSFLPRSNNSKIEQQGLGGLTCRYFIQIGVSYWQEQDIKSLSSETRTVVELSAKQNYTSAIYRFYVPSLTKSITFSYQDCKVEPGVIQTMDDPCPVDLRVRPNGLPFIRKTPPVLCQSDTACSVELKEPKEDTWYYMRMDLSEQVAVDLSLGVEVQKCTEENVHRYNVPVEEEELPHWEFTQNTSLASPQWERLYNASASFDPSSENTPRFTPDFLVESVHMAPLPDNYLPASRAQSARVSPGWCPPVVSLSSAQLGGSNPFKTFILNAANSTGSVEVPPDLPVVLKFELDVLQDIGGNLIINGYIAKETEQGTLEYDDLTFITLCLRRGAIPPLNRTEISCDPDYSIAFNNASVGSVLPWTVPFPAPGVWYLSLESKCKSKAGMVPCNWTTYVDLDISLFGCIDDCGEYGTCHSSVDMGILFYYCKCSRGYQGWGCTDDTEAWSQAYFLTRLLLLTLSNIFFIFPCLLALKRRHFVPAISFFCTLVFSSFYHSCDSGSLCIMSFNTLQFCDFYAAFMSIYLTLITMAKLPVPLKNSLEILGAFGMALGTSYNRFSLWAVAIPVGVGLTVMLISWSRRWYKRRQCYPTTKWRWLLFILPGTAVIITGLCVFAFLETSDNYQYVHSAWHVSMAIGVSFLLPPRERKDKQHYNHISELVDINTLNSELVVNDDPGY